MSSRSKERVTAAIRKFFRSPKKQTTNDAVVVVDGGKTGTATTDSKQEQQSQPSTTNTASTTTVTTSTTTTNNNNNNNTSNAVGISSPGKRLRCAISPATNTVGGSVAKPIDTTIRSRRLMKEFKEIQRTQHAKPSPAFTVELVNDNLYEWFARLYHIDPDSQLAEDLAEFNYRHILLHIVFPDNFPFAPPFMRVVEPKIEKGFVMEGGAICMELLTPRGWASAYTIEAILMQFAASLVKGQGRVSRKVKGNKDFTKRSAEEAFRSLVKTHDKYGWVTPSLSDG